MRRCAHSRGGTEADLLTGDGDDDDTFGEDGDDSLSGQFGRDDLNGGNGTVELAELAPAETGHHADRCLIARLYYAVPTPKPRRPSPDERPRWLAPIV